VPANSVQISNVVTHSSRSYVAAPITIGQPFYTDRMYTLSQLPVRRPAGLFLACGTVY
jgi:hypothetical protein